MKYTRNLFQKFISKCSLKRKFDVLENLEIIKNSLTEEKFLKNEKEISGKIEEMKTMEKYLIDSEAMSSVVEEWMDDIRDQLETTITVEGWDYTKNLKTIVFLYNISELFTKKEKIHKTVELLILKTCNLKTDFNEETITILKHLTTLLEGKLTSTYLKSLLYCYIKNFEEDLNKEFNFSRVKDKKDFFLSSFFSKYVNRDVVYIKDYVDMKTVEYICGQTNSILSKITEQTETENSKFSDIINFIESKEFDKNQKEFWIDIKNLKMDSDDILDLFIEVNCFLLFEAGYSRERDLPIEEFSVKNIHNLYFEQKFKENFESLKEFKNYRNKHFESIKLKTKGAFKDIKKVFKVVLFFTLIKEFKGQIEDKRDLERLKDMWENLELFIESEKLKSLSELLKQAQEEITIIFNEMNKGLPNFKELIEEEKYENIQDEDFEI